jgi:hypothetical protein
MADHLTHGGASHEAARDVTVEALRQVYPPRILLTQHGAKGRDGVRRLPLLFLTGLRPCAHACSSLALREDSISDPMNGWRQIGAGAFAFKPIRRPASVEAILNLD